MGDPRTVLITGGAGNLGSKLAAYLSAQDWCEKIVLTDVVAPRILPPKAEAAVSDLLDPAGSWRAAAVKADAVVHFAAVNPYPNASFADAADSLQMTGNLFLALAETEARVVFATSNHVMGRYKEEALGPAELTTELPPLPGTRSIENGVLHDEPAYAAAKLMGERLLLAVAGAPKSKVTGVALRIGWCQPGENHPRTISGDGLPVDTDAKPVTGDALRDLTWFRNMWLSNRDFCGIVEAALRADPAGWPARALVLNAMSNNRGMPWDLGPTRRYLGYAPQDDAWALLG
jgi:nucleoside-diphosphate-sugar epimerase